MIDNQIWIGPMSAEHILDPPVLDFYSENQCSLSLHLIAGKESFCIVVICPWTSYFCYSFNEVNRCLTSIADTYYGGLNHGNSRLSEKG